MNLEHYLHPTNSIASAIVVILGIAFIVWLLILFFTTRTIFIRTRRLSSCSDITYLRSIIAKSRARISDEHTDLNLGNISTKEYFTKYAKSNTLPEDDPISVHLKSIFDAGYFETRLDVSELLRHTSQRLFSYTSFLRGLLGSFIVLGLLGTLIGLADSLIQFSEPIQTSTRAWSNEQIRSSISNLLLQLRGAFAPSISGVALTIIGVLLYTLYIRFICAPAQHLLDHLTINVWIPQLIPTTPLRLVETLKRSEEQMRQSFQAAEKVAEFAKEIQNEASEFNTNLKSSNKVLKQLSEIGTSLSGFATKFEQGTAKIVSFQEELHSLYKQSLENSSTLKENVGIALKEAQAFQSTISTTLCDQGQQLQLIVASLKSYETAYLAQRQQIDQALQKLLESVNQTLSQIDSKNKELIENFGNPLIQKLHDELSSVENTLRVQLNAIVQQFQRFDTPINDAAQKVAGALDAVDKRTTALKEELQRLFMQREKQVDIQLTVFNDLASTLVTLLTQMTSTAQTQSERMQYLAQSINNLQDTVKSTKHSKFDQIPVKEIQKQRQEEERWPKRIIARIARAFTRD
ncbi:MAG: hypothetical protein V1799_18770 [bacterium]